MAPLLCKVIQILRRKKKGMLRHNYLGDSTYKCLALGESKFKRIQNKRGKFFALRQN